LPIEIALGKKRPEKPVQAAKLASEARLVIRSSMPVLTHWKEYKDEDNNMKEFIGHFSVSKSIPSISICTFHKSLYQMLIAKSHDLLTST
jgi:hypothetical protein